MARGFLEFQRVRFRHEGAPAALFTDLSFRLESGFTGLVGPNGAGKTTLLLLAARCLAPAAGRVLAPDAVAFCPQRTEEPPSGLAELLARPDRRAAAVLARLRVEADFAARWPTLSHGERKRAQVAAALAGAPELLLLDEPTNHLDSEARDLLAAELARFPGAALLVSHDRELLDLLAVRCLFLAPEGVELRTGNYSEASAARAHDRAARAAERRAAVREAKRLRAESERRARAAEDLTRRITKRGLAKKDHDAKARVDAARVSGIDTAAMNRAKAVGSRARMAEERRDAIPLTKERRLGLPAPGARSARPTLVRFAARELPLGGGRILAVPDLAIGAADRTGLAGPNGTGKTTLLRALLAESGLPAERVLHLPQEIDARRSAETLEAARALPRAARGEVFTRVSRLGSDPEALLATPVPSPGETRKLLLATGLSAEPWLLVLDEPTNHLDLPSIECLEAALAECRGALLIVSHDERFLGALTTRRLRTVRTADGAELTAD